MDIKKKLLIGSAGLLAAGTFAVGVASAASTDTTVPPTTTPTTNPVHPKLTPAEKCAKQSDAAARVAQAKQRLADRKAKLEARRATAVTNGNQKAITRIDQRLARIQQISDRVDARYARYLAWVAKHC
ncbi:MAG: hypothetical protein WCI22_06610 [Actinomycetota bacterium]